MKKIQLGGHKKESLIKGYAVVDDEDFEYLKQFKWYTTWNGYAIRAITKVNGKQGYIRMSREVFGTIEKNLFVDHIDGDKLNNQRTNLRLATKSQNGMNRGKPSHNTSGYKGVHFSKLHSKWRVQIKKSGKIVCDGLYKNIKDAVKAYDEAALKYHREFACLNKV